MPKLHLPLFLLSVVSLILSGCAAPIGDGANAFDHFLTEEVSMMVQTNADPNLPEPEQKEVILRKGTRVRLIDRSSNMALVETMNGERGRVPSIDLDATDENRGDEPQAKMGKTIQW